MRSISTHNGCSLGAATDYVTMEAGTLKNPGRLLLHEVAHACGLWHSRRPGNLMISKGPGEDMNFLQTAVLRTSRHVTFF